MLKIKAPLKKLSAAVALGLFAGTASASVSIFNTFPFGNSLEEPLNPPFFPGDEPEWAAGRFVVDAFNCPNGCVIDRARLSLRSPFGPFDPSPLGDGVSLAVYSSVPAGFDLAGNQLFQPSERLFDLSTPDSFFDNGNFGTDVWFEAPAQDTTAEALLQPNTAYWIKLTNESLSYGLEWFFNGVNEPGQYWAAWHGEGFGSPFIFEIMGTNCETCAQQSPVPVPNAIWLMGTAMLGLVTAWRRKLSS